MPWLSRPEASRGSSPLSRNSQLARLTRTLQVGGGTWLNLLLLSSLEEWESIGISVDRNFAAIFQSILYMNEVLSLNHGSSGLLNCRPLVTLTRLT